MIMTTRTVPMEIARLIKGECQARDRSLAVFALCLRLSLTKRRPLPCPLCEVPFDNDI